MRGGYTPVSSRAARRLEAVQQKLAASMQDNSAETCTLQESCCESLPSRLGFVMGAPELQNFDSPAHMLPGPDQCTESTPEAVELNVVRLQPIQKDVMTVHVLLNYLDQYFFIQRPSLEEQLKPVSGGGSFHVLPLKALLGTTPPSTGQYQPLKFSKAVFSFSDNTEQPELKSSGAVTDDTVRAQSLVRLLFMCILWHHFQYCYMLVYMNIHA